MYFDNAFNAAEIPLNLQAPKNPLQAGVSTNTK